FAVTHMPISKSFLKFLEAKKAKYELVEHRRVFTAYDKAATLHVDPKTVVKTAVFQAGSKEHALVFVPASKHIDKKKVKTAINIWLRAQSKKPESKVDFATEQWMKKNMSGDVGATAALPEALGMYAFVDGALFKPAKLYLNIGSYEVSISVNQANFKKILGKSFVKGAFAKAK
ncbi:MAG: YbaK/EbsC family protein, partial [bacterium]|nr:YbaK/EbsC family protein [bacterium]